MIVLVTGQLPVSALALLGEADIRVVDGTKDRKAFLEAARGVDAVMTFVVDKVDAELLDAAGPQLKIVANVAVGYDNIDVPSLKQRGVVVTNTPDVLNGAVAELTWGMILAITRRLGESERLVRRGDWSGWAFDFMTGMELAGKTLGIIGKGRIGRDVARRAAAFDMQVVYGGRTAGGKQDGHPILAIDDVLKTADIVSLHVPLRPDTRHLIDARAIALMKPTAYLINTARGPVVDEAALAEALVERRIAGAALDVFEREPVVYPQLFELDNVLLLPHIGSATVETRTAMAELAARNVAAVLAGQAPLTPL
jgi:glyoxylate reductase